MSEITSTTNLYDYPIILLRFAEKYEGTAMPLNAENANKIWESLSDADKKLNNELESISFRDVANIGIRIVNKNTKSIIKEICFG